MKNSSENFYSLEITFRTEDAKNWDEHVLSSINSNVIYIISLKSTRASDEEI